MNWVIHEACKINCQDISSAVIIDIQSEKMEEVCIGLCMLFHKVVSRVRLTDFTSRSVIISTSKLSRRAWVRKNNSELEIILDFVEIEYWMHFFLRAIRDNQAEVDHIDVDASSDTGSEEIPLIIRFSNSAPSFTPDEVRQRLGLK
jgi:hypothetical protein